MNHSSRQICALVQPFLRQESLPGRPLVAVAAAVMAGCVAGSTLGSQGFWWGWMGASAALLAWAGLARWGRPAAAGVALLGAVTFATGAWSVARTEHFSVNDIAWQLGDTPRPVAIRGIVLESPQLVPPPAGDERRAAAVGPASGCVIRVTAVRWGSRWQPAAGRANVVVAAAPVDLLAGMGVAVLGRGVRPSSPLNPGEPDAARRARESRQLSIVRVRGWEHVRVTSRPAWWAPMAAIDRLRTRAAAVLEARIAPQRSGLAAALLLGQRGGLSRDMADEFVVTGTIHVLAISGLHVSLLAIGLFMVFRGIGVSRPWAGVAVAIVTGIYMLLVGAGTPVVRATILVWIACAAVAVGRRPATMNSLAIASIIVCLWRPPEVFGVGAQLSFLSTAILAGVASVLRRPRETDPINRLIERSRSWQEKLLRKGGGWIVDATIASAAVWLATAPLVAHRFHVVSLVGLVVNVLVAAVVPVAMAGGFLCLVTAALPGPLASVFGAGCDLSLAVIERLVSWGAALPGGHAWVAGPQAWWVVGWYALLIAALLVLRADLIRRAMTWGTLALVWSLVGLAADVATPRVGAPGLRVVMAAVGHGCGIVVTSPTGRCLVYDAGRLGAPAAARRSLEAVLWSERITWIDTLVISHADADHFNAVPALLARFGVGEILVPEPLLACQSISVCDLLDAAKVYGVPVRTVQAGDSFAIDPLCRGRVLHPHGATADATVSNNETSIVLSLEAAGRRVLLTGDLEGQPLKRFVAAMPGECDVLVAPHHGSRTSLPADIAVATSPECVLVSGRTGRSWPEVQAAYAAAADVSPEAVLHTANEGAIAVMLTADRVTAEQFVGGRWWPVRLSDDQAVDVETGFVSTMATVRRTNWLATYPPRSMRTPLVKP